MFEDTFSGEYTPEERLKAELIGVEDEWELWILWRRENAAREQAADSVAASERTRALSYRDYLLTPEWQDKRARALKRARHRCEVCYRNRDLNIHHRTYDRRGDERDDDLTVLCAHCHTTFHVFGSWNPADRYPSPEFDGVTWFLPRHGPFGPWRPRNSGDTST